MATRKLGMDDMKTLSAKGIGKAKPKAKPKRVTAKAAAVDDDEPGVYDWRRLMTATHHRFA